MYVAGASSSSRITGMVSGMDVDETVANLMIAEMSEYDSVYQKKVLSEWEQDAYRSVTTEISSFEDTYFDYTNNDNNMLSESTYLNYNCSTSDSSCVTVSSSGTPADETHSIEVVQLATAAYCQGTPSITSTIDASSSYDFTSGNGTTLTLTLDGTSRDISIDDSITDVASLQDAIDTTFGSGKIVVNDTLGTLAFDVVDGSGVHNLSLSDSDDDCLEALGFISTDQLDNRISEIDSLETLSSSLETPFQFDSNNQVNLTINGLEFTFDETDTVQSMMETINNSDADVTMEYDTINDQFSLTTDNTGQGDTLSFSETDSTLFASLGLYTVTEGQDAIVTLDGEDLTRSSNVIEVNDISYTLHAVTTEAVTVSTTYDVQSTLDMITDFVASYNDLITSLDASISEECDSDYPPLTESQENDMSEDEIASWNESAKSGVLANDSVIEDLLSDMRRALYSSVPGCDYTLYDIGITTGSYGDGGKLSIDENKLMEALESNPEEIVKLFCEKSDSYPSSSARGLDFDERSIRTSECGIMWKMFDIIEESVSTKRDLDGNKGLLLEKAGITSDTSAIDNILSKKIEGYDEMLLELEDFLEDKESYYYEKYTYMETYISEMNSQLEAMQSSFG